MRNKSGCPNCGGLIHQLKFKNIDLMAFACNSCTFRAFMPL